MDRFRDEKITGLYTISNSSGIVAKVLDFGATLVSLFVKDRNGMFRDVVLGPDTLTGYEESRVNFGATIGRCANRIKGGSFILDGKEYKLDCNDGKNHLHGGYDGFSRRRWNTEQIGESSIKFTLFSPDGDQNYPGNLISCVIYNITDNVLEIKYRGFCDRKTLFNLTNHTYFNLAGEEADTVLDQELRVDADAITEIIPDLCITGNIMFVEGTPFDFRTAKKIGLDIFSDHPQIRYANGFDHNYVLNRGH